MRGVRRGAVSKPRKYLRGETRHKEGSREAITGNLNDYFRHQRKKVGEKKSGGEEKRKTGARLCP